MNDDDDGGDGDELHLLQVSVHSAYRPLCGW